jgi:hypothetical protein
VGKPLPDKQKTFKPNEEDQMKRFKTKCATIAVAIGCMFTCLGFGVFAMAQPSQANVTADAETAYTTYTL